MKGNELLENIGLIDFAYVEAAELSDTVRAQGGFGSTGK